MIYAAAKTTKKDMKLLNKILEIYLDNMTEIRMQMLLG